MEIQRRASGSLVPNSLSPTQDSNDVAWISAENWKWHNFTDLPSSVQSLLTSQNLTPSTILMDSFGSPDDEDEIQGWMVGSDRFSMFILDSSGTTAKGHVFKFAEPAIVKKATIPSDLSNQDVQGPVLRQPSPEEINLEISMLPEKVRRMILAVRDPIDFAANFVRRKPEASSLMMISNFACYNKVSFISVNAIQKVVGGPGIKDQVLEAEISKSPWQVRIVYSKLT